jgi:hypothetical protein
MSDKEKPLPKPPNKAFGRKNNFESQEEPASLLADRMAAAAAEGKLDDFLKQEMPDNEYARNLASMMMGMTGMMPGSMTGMSMNPGPEKMEELSGAAGDIPPNEVPEDVKSAIMGGDLQGLMGLLRREYQKRNPEAAAETQAESPPPPQQTSPSLHQPTIDKEIIEALVGIASENSVTPDWIILRAVKLYVQEYQKTGKL